ncbi:MAG: hypothetical protein PUF82_07905, partial [Lactobacillus equicursoris]|uniref:hypothetical protein n=1 Tax=Lactobacillus equicursoris TaxID=420645 RepID=UPI002432A17D
SNTGVHYGRIGSTPITAIGKRLFGVVFLFYLQGIPEWIVSCTEVYSSKNIDAQKLTQLGKCAHKNLLK